MNRQHIEMNENTGCDEAICSSCTSLVMEPYIKCSKCHILSLCLHCFAKGVEFDEHKNDHPYCVVKNSFPVFEKNWTALEEIHLLKAIADCGYGNWVDIALKVRTKSHYECERHYNTYFIENVSNGLPTFPEAQLSVFPCPVVYKLCEDPPRPAEGSLLTTEMAGYMAGRGDFTTEHENFMEIDLRNLEFDANDEPLETDLKLAVVDVYRRCLKERFRRKRIIRKYGLINLRKIARLRVQYESSFIHIVDCLPVFAQLVTADDYEMFLAALHYEKQLKVEILHLQQYRSNGLSKKHHIKMYRLLKKARETERCDRHLLNDVINHVRDENACQSWLQRQAALESLGKSGTMALPNAARKAAPPLDITGFPSYDKLTNKEREMCSQLRLVPIAFLDFKNALINENSKHGSLKLAHARQLIKIDVNKTRKIYDFLVMEGCINKDV